MAEEEEEQATLRVQAAPVNLTDEVPASPLEINQISERTFLDDVKVVDVNASDDEEYF